MTFKTNSPLQEQVENLNQARETRESEIQEILAKSEEKYESL